MNLRTYLLLALLLLTGALAGCAGTKPLASAARAGDTIALGAGWKQRFDHYSLTATITDAAGNVTTYAPGSPSLRAVINLYPDPLSYIMVGTRIGLNTNYNYGSTYGSVVNNSYTHYDPDWWQTSIYLDLPATMAVGTAQVTFSSANGETYGPIPVEIISGVGSPSTFSAQGLTGGMSPVQLQSMERAPLSVVKFSGGSTLPDSIQIDLTHDPDSSVGGTGKAFVVNPRGEMKNLSWTDNGTNLRVLLTSSGDGTAKDPYFTGYKWKYFKFYVTGGVTGVQVNNVTAYDSNGNPIAGVTAMATAQ